MFNSLVATLVSCHNMTVEDIKCLKEDGTEYLTHLHREVSPYSLVNSPYINA
jgi:hypothetical protein